MTLKKFCPFTHEPCMEGACMFWDIIEYYQKFEKVTYGSGTSASIPHVEAVFGCLIKKQ